MIEYAGLRPALRTRGAEGAATGSLLARLDWVLLAATGALLAYGLWVLAGITRHDVPADPHYYVLRQAIFAGVGIAGLAVVTLVDPEVYRRYRRVLYVGLVGSMLLILLTATAVRGSKRWIDLGFFRFQPSEFGKLLIVLCLAGYLAERGKRLAEPRVILTAVGIAAGPILLVFVQPDIGTALVYAAALAAVLFVAGARWWQLMILGLATLFAALSILWLLPAAGVQLLKPYQTSRITGFLNPSKDPRDSTYNISQSITTVGAGGLKGRGVSGATQTNLNYLPEHATDFAFASLAEQRGFFGAGVLLLLYLLVVWRGLKIVTVSRDSFGAIVAGGISIALLFQIFVNVGMTMGIAPITGIPLPFVSNGGSSLIANLLSLGVLQAIHVRGTSGRRPLRRR